MEKKNQIPKYPHLRFPEFTDEWKEVTLGEVAEISKGSGISKDQLSPHGLPCILYGELYTKYSSELISEIISHTELDPLTLIFSKAEDVIIPSSGETAIDIAVARCVPIAGVAIGGDLNIIRSEDTDGAFLAYQLNGIRKKGIAKMAQGSSIVHLYGHSLSKLAIAYPSLPEQRKIAALLSLIDERIEVQNAISNDLESLIVGFYNSVQYVTKAGWHKVRLRDLLTIRKEQNTSGSYEVYSVSVSRGIVNQIVHLGRSFAAANTSNYGVVHPGDLVYTKSPTGQFPFGIVKQNHNASPVAVSPLYGVYRPISPEVGTLLHYFFLSPLRANNYLAPLIQKGAKNTINIRTDHFLDNVVLLPKDEKELRCIADCLLALDERLSVEREYVELLKQQKAYLLRQMFI